MTQVTLRCINYNKGMFNDKIVWDNDFLCLDSYSVEKEQIVGENLLHFWKCDFVDFIEISGNRCANTTFTDQD